MKTTYSHAAPYIRERLVSAVLAGKAATTKLERSRKFNEAYAYSQALKIMAASQDQEPAPGIADRSGLGTGIRMAREWLGSDADLILGPEEEELDLDQHYCPDCKHPWSYHGEHGCSMSVTPGTNMPIGRGSDARERCDCSSLPAK